jgi:hypothetical protein
MQKESHYTNLVAPCAVSKVTALIITFAIGKKLVLDFLGPLHGIIQLLSSGHCSGDILPVMEVLLTHCILIVGHCSLQSTVSFALA